MSIKKVLHIPVQQKYIACLAIILLVITASLKTGHCYPVNFRDGSGRDISLAKEPLSVVSLDPSITEIILRIGAGDKLKAVTIPNNYPSEAALKPTAGSVDNPDLEKVANLNPDVIFYSDTQKGVLERFGKSSAIVINLQAGSIGQSFRCVEILGGIFNRKNEAEGIINANKRYIETIKKKTKHIPLESRKRVLYILNDNGLMIAGDSSFQREIINLAGGIPLTTGRNGNGILIDIKSVKDFNPQVIYSCENDRGLISKLLSAPELKDVEAIKNFDVHYYPCELTCRLSTNTGYFIEWLSADLYSDEYAKKKNLILPEQVVNSSKLDLKLDYVNDIRIDTSNLYNFTNKTLIIEFKAPINVLSTLEGMRRNIKTIGNHYAPLSCWSVADKDGLKGMREKGLKVLGKSEAETSFLLTGADVDNVAIIRESYKEMSVYAVVTAGVKSNAMRMSVDEGGYYEPGTINILLLPNMKLTERAMTGAIITTTEAKSAALQDLDIRSGYSPWVQATGTGTDNIIIVQGSGEKILDVTGGHTKLGELIAKAVNKGVKEAIYKQNGIIAKRDIFQRLKERRINISEELFPESSECKIGKRELTNRLERLILEPEYEALISSSFSISDDYEGGLTRDLTQYKKWCINIARDISGTDLSEIKDYTADNNIPVVIKMVLNSLLTGLCNKE